MAKTNLVMGMDEQTYNQTASNYARGKITWWLISGTAAILVIHPHHPLISFGLLFIPGIFVIALLAVPLFWIRVQKYKIVPTTRNVLVLILFTLTSLIDFLLPITAAIFAVKLFS